MDPKLTFLSLKEFFMSLVVPDRLLYILLPGDSNSHLVHSLYPVQLYW
jgi:hypothetical protein